MISKADSVQMKKFNRTINFITPYENEERDTTSVYNIKGPSVAAKAALHATCSGQAARCDALSLVIAATSDASKSI